MSISLLFFARESLEIQPEGKKHEKEGDSFPEHNFENIIKVIFEDTGIKMCAKIDLIVLCLYLHKLVCVCVFL